MPDRKNIYRIDEQMLRNTLLGYSVDFNASHCDSIEQEVSSISMQKPITLPNTRALMRFVLLPALVLVSGIFIYANADTIQDWFTSPVEIPKANTEAKKTPPVVKQQPVPGNTPSPVVNTVESKKDSVLAEPVKKIERPVIKNDVTSLEIVAKKASPVVALPPSDSVAKAETKKDEIKNTSWVDSALSAPASVKKKKRRRHHTSNAMDELKESTLQSSSADEDVVVPQ